MDPEQETQDTATEETLETAETADTGAAMDEAAPAWEERVQELQQEAEQARAAAVAHGAEAESLRSQLADTLGRYREMLLARDPDVPVEMVQGESVAELESSYEQASGLVERLRRRAAEHAAQARVPAGAPARRGLDLGGLTPQQKIVQGLQQSN